MPGYDGPAMVQRYIEAAYATAAQRDSAHERAVTQLCEAEIALRQGQVQRAAALLDLAQAAFERMVMAWHAHRAGELRLLANQRAA